MTTPAAQGLTDEQIRDYWDHTQNPLLFARSVLAADRQQREAAREPSDEREFLEIVLHALMTGMAVSPAINAVRARLSGAAPAAPAGGDATP